MIMLNRPVPDGPTTVDQAVDRILDKLTKSQKDEIRKTPVADLDLLHFGLGTAIRNECGLWDGNTALLAACGTTDMHPDLASDVILRAVWEKLRAGQATPMTTPNGPSSGFYQARSGPAHGRRPKTGRSSCCLPPVQRHPWQAVVHAGRDES